MSTSASSGPTPKLGLHELVAFCEELSALVRAGVPLGVGLRGGGFGSGWRMNAVAARLAAHEERGRSLPEALAAEAGTWPPALRAVVEAGLATGRLPEALDAVARCARMQADVRLRIGSALVYPAVLLVTASWLLGYFAERLVAGIEGVYATGPLGPPAWLAPLSAAARTAWLWCHAVPIFVLVSAILWSQRGKSATAGGAVLPLAVRWAPGLWGLQRNFRLGALSDFLALLTMHGVPLPQAWRLAGESTGHRATAAACDHVADAVAHGQSLAAALGRTRAFPPLFRGIVESAERQGGLPSAFAQLAGAYYRRAERQCEWARVTLPVLMTVVVGGGIVVAYAATVFLPVLRMMFDLMSEGG